MANRDLLLLIGFFRNGKMYPTVISYKALNAERSLKFSHEAMAEQELALFGKRARAHDPDDIKRRSALTSWSGELLGVGTRVEEIPDPGVLLALLYDVSIVDAPLPVEVCAQTLRRYALRDPALRAKFDEHVDMAGTFVPSWLSPEVRRKRSQEAFDAAMKVAREKGFAHAVPLFEGVRGECYPAAQVAIAVHERRELGDHVAALERLNEVLRVAPRNVAARIQRAKILLRDPSRKVESAQDFLVVLRETAPTEPGEAPQSVSEAAIAALWGLHRDYAEPKALEAALALAKQDTERGFQALSHYVHTHPCCWDAQLELARMAILQQRYDVATKLLATSRWLFGDDPRPHLMIGQALTARGQHEAALAALEHALALSPRDAEARRWLDYARSNLTSEDEPVRSAPGISMASHAARTLFVLAANVHASAVDASAIVLHRIPGDVSLAIVVQAMATQETRRRGLMSTTELEVRAAGERCVMTDYNQQPLSTEHTVADVADPGVVLGVLFDSVQRDQRGRPLFNPPPDQCRATLLDLAQKNAEIAARLKRHLASPDAQVKQHQSDTDEAATTW